MLKTALIALVLSLALASRASEQPQNPSLSAQARKDSDIPQVLPPDAVICSVAVRGATPGTVIPVPAGQQPTDICPRTAITSIYYHNHPGITKIRPTAGVPAPAVEDADQGQPP